MIFTAVGGTNIVILGIGKQSNISVSNTKYVAGDPMNPASYLIERFYEKQYSIDELSVLAAHAVIQSARFNVMVSGMQGLTWRIGEKDAQPLDAADYQSRSQNLERDMMAVVLTAMGARTLLEVPFIRAHQDAPVLALNASLVRR